MTVIPSLPAEIHRTDSLNGGHVHISNDLDDVPIENFRPLRVVVIGAGFSGINAAIRIPQRLKNVDLSIYEKNPDIGGTWYENRYPGCACDVPAHSYQYSYNPNRDWSGFYASAEEIHGYLKSIAKTYSAERFIKCNHRVLGCKWLADEGKWHITVCETISQRTFVDKADVVISARGNLNDIQWPDIEGLQTFQGKLMHSATWDKDVDLTGKTIGLIGAGSSAIQILPHLQKAPQAQVKTFIRSKTWISRPFGIESMEKLGMESTKFSKEQRERLLNDDEYYHEFRKQVERDANAVHFLTLRDSKMQHETRKLVEADMRQRLGKAPELADLILPSFAVGCRRLTPGVGYLEALQEPNVQVISTRIERVTPTGLQLVDQTHVDLDVLICATGFKTAKAPPFPILGRGSVDMGMRFEPYPETYLSVAMDGYPNFFMILGPNSLVGTGSQTMILEAELDYTIRCIRKLQRDNIQAMEAKRERVKEFSDYIDKYFPQTVYLDDCSSWYRNENGRGGRITGLWPGSALHAIETFRSPRWEDYEYEYMKDESGKPVSQLKWLGNGWTYAQRHGGDLAPYLKLEFLDTPAQPLPEETAKYSIWPFTY
ncbi:uncharacterized protein NECHADRAFT_45940 [Fusarium vanettenii 77-13-4]|uniref:Uncharacterized protein n=1 Tax=Fusarium vanettenii (strain ATCC MYA-4622 / CBS 123669 / FGSC 9596 / NRRL 45880 / 77-13-4) TaxID=660122 RepID=C7Z3I5_FUSV7|nr:uncharacterized protein NECHADRAFT_45940 [Fusarium vanettenii 77-13-4]EEU41316.1 hypothetical protein NECHADRAFT_45940 [Fusarium vanettenii 77-13-4]